MTVRKKKSPKAVKVSQDVLTRALTAYFQPLTKFQDDVSGAIDPQEVVAIFSDDPVFLDVSQEEIEEAVKDAFHELSFVLNNIAVFPIVSRTGEEAWRVCFEAGSFWSAESV